MTLVSVQKIRQNLKDAEFYKIQLNTGQIVETNTSFAFWLDDKELLICIRANDNHYTKFKAPFSITAYEYNNIHMINGYYSKED